jgi:penicillin-binding protein 2
MLDEDIRVPGWRLGALALLVFAAMGVLLSRLWNVQIVNSQSAQVSLERQTTVKARLAPARGLICDRNGVALAENRPSFDIDLYLDDLRRDYPQSHRDIHGRLGKIPTVPLPDGKDGRKRVDVDIVRIVKESIEPINQALGLNVPLNEKDIREHFRTDRDLPYHYLTDLDFATVAQFAERNLGVPGISISQSPVRQYTYGAFAAHILGYVGKPAEQDESQSSDGTPYETVGRQGIEEIMDAQLQGQPGSRIQRVSSAGYYIPDKQLDSLEVPPTMGNTIYLTIDARIQYIVESALRNAGIGRGAAIVMDPRNGDVLAMASIPSYDPNKFIPRISTKDYDALNNDPTAPLYNRALHALAPGSTYKIMVALAGLKSGNVTVDTPFDCPGAIQIDDHLFHNSDSTDAGTMSLVHAICVSSDVFFYQYGIRAGIDAIDSMGKLAGFGHRWGLLGDSAEDPGILPGPQWMKDNDVMLRKKHEIDHWSHAQTANTAIGQGYVLVTPLQMATFLCAVANGGTVYQPRIYSRVVTSDGKEEAAPAPGVVFSNLGMKPSDLKAVQEGMREVVEEGTGTLAQVPGVSIAGKTGTAQAYIKIDGEVRRDLKCWFYCYGPFEAPRYVTCVLVEGGTWGGTTTAPIAQEIMRRLFAMDAGAVEAPTFLQPVAGNFNGVTEVDTQTNTSSAQAAVDTSNGSTMAPSPDDNNASTPSGDVPPGSIGNPHASTKHAH